MTIRNFVFIRGLQQINVRGIYHLVTLSDRDTHASIRGEGYILSLKFNGRIKTNAI